MTCVFKENIYNTGESTCKDDGNYYVCDSDGTWSKKSSCSGMIITAIVIGIPLFVVGSMITVKVGQWGLSKL